ncbi:MAG: hypothetical protein II605_03935, partial [Paludibacteraceae bacterium]|nr:hypothetical protein [Paludibacteraceae bacterium]
MGKKIVILLKKNVFFSFWTGFCKVISEKSCNFVVVMRNIPTVTRYLLIGNFIVFFLAYFLQR